MMLKNSTFINWQLLPLFSLLFFSGFAQSSSQFKNVQLHGFFMQSFLKTDRNNFLGSLAGKGSFDYTEIGVNTSAKLSSNVQTAIQFLSRRAGKTDNGSIKLDFALLDYRLVDSYKTGIGFRIGRIKNPIGLYNETRDVSFTRESIILPQSIYFERVRDVSISADGVHLYGHKLLKYGSFQGTVVAVRPRASADNSEYALLGGLRQGAINGDLSSGGQIKFESNDSRFVAAVSNVMLRLKYKSASGESGFADGANASINFYMNILSMKYNLAKWSFTGEYALRKMIFTGFPSIPTSASGAFIPDVTKNITGESYYLQTVYRWNSKVRFIARYDVLFADRKDRQGTNYENALKPLQPSTKGYSRYAKDTMLGLQYHINWRWMTRVEVHSIDGTAWLPVQENPASSKVKRYWRMINASVSYRF